MKKRHLRVIEQINSTIPRSLLDNLMKTELAFPTMRALAEAAIKAPETPEDERRKYQMILDSGYFDKTVQLVDVSIEKQISEYMDAQIAKAVEEGLLPKNIRVPTLKNKSKKYVNKEIKKGNDSRKDWASY